MATVDDAAKVIGALGEVTEGERHGHRTWSVDGKPFAWVRPFSKADIRRFGEEEPPKGPILALTVADLAEKEAVLAEGIAGVFTIPHFDGYAAVLVNLPDVRLRPLRELVLDAWLVCAPDRLTEQYRKR